MDKSSENKAKSEVSRRDFLRGSGLAFGGFVAGIAGVKFLSPGSKEKVTKAKGHIEQVSFEESACTSCGTCELVCAAVHGGSVGPSLRRIWLSRDPIGLMHNVLTCQQCDYPGCYYACPRKDEALYIDSKNGARCINQNKCEPDCGLCAEACLLDTPRINYDAERDTYLICDLCKDRTEGPACVEYCPAECLILKEK